MARYAHRDQLKEALGIPSSVSGGHSQLDDVLEGVSRFVDDFLGYRAGPASGVRYYRPVETSYLEFDYPLLAVDSIALDTDGDSTYESTLSTSDYNLTPYNATEESPKRPWWGIELRDVNATAAFPKGVKRGARVTGTWGYYNERVETTARPATAIDATQVTIAFTGASNLHVGQMARLDGEQVFIKALGVNGSDTASSVATVLRAQGGTTGATHSSLSTMSIYDYPIVNRAALYQAEMDWRGRDAPLGIAGGEPGGGQRLSVGLHPFVRRILDGFRLPRVG